MNKTLVLFHTDFRLHDHPALTAAAERGCVLPVYIGSLLEETTGGSASRWWLHHALHAFQQRLLDNGLSLIIRQGDRETVVQELLEETGATAVYFNERYELQARSIDASFTSQFISKGIEVKQFSSFLLQPPTNFYNAQGQPYQIYTAYLKRFQMEPVPWPLPVPIQLQGDATTYPSLAVEDLHLLPKHSWCDKLHTYWQPGEMHAIEAWRKVLKERLIRYDDERDYPAANMVSRLSPHLAFGEISVRGIWHAIEREKRTARDKQLHASLNTFQRQLVWRDFAYHQFVHFPEMAVKPLRSQFLSFPWREDEEAFRRWTLGQTGYPIVDAGMRQLWETGWMHNRVRMIVASFLVKHLLLPWQEGQRWFAQTLVDYDAANNAMGWQWSAGCGVDAAPYFRIFNPILQAEKFDAEGSYIRQWVPELKKLPTSYIYAPWKAPQAVLQEADIQLGKTYPLPIVEHSFARQRALEAYGQVKGK